MQSRTKEQTYIMNLFSSSVIVEYVYSFSLYINVENVFSTALILFVFLILLISLFAVSIDDPESELTLDPIFLSFFFHCDISKKVSCEKGPWMTELKICYTMSQTNLLISREKQILSVEAP